MKDLKIKVSSEAESKEAQELLFELGAKKVLPDIVCFSKNVRAVCCICNSVLVNTISFESCSDELKETTLAELRGMVKPMKEYLNKTTYEYKLAHTKPDGDWVGIPEGAEALTTDGEGKRLIFWKDGFNFVIGLDEQWAETVTNFKEFLLDYPKCFALWVRPTQPEALPFIDDNPQRLNDQYAEIEQVRQAIKVKSGSNSDHMADAMSYGLMGIKQDNVNHPSHYTQGKVECIDALESATIGKSGIEAVCVANIIKYLWRYEEKNGIEDIKKANFYLNRLIATLENNNG